MYRDASSDLDEKDRAVGAILIAEAMFSNCETAAAMVTDSKSHARWKSLRDAHDDYPEIWRQLDRARKELSKRGVNTIAYEELRPSAKPTFVLPKGHNHEVDNAALDDARRAIAELKLAVPGADWKAIYKRTNDLVERPAIKKSHTFAATAAIASFIAGVLAFAIAITPDKKPDPRVVMRQELAGVAVQRDINIDRLGLIANRVCASNTAHEYVRLLVQDGRGDAAKQFGSDYTSRCGADRIVSSWANATIPHH
ncbi:MAG TPA: hypothetical protein VGM90_30485 [Kofleriaceae bacterium]|jgi:hypothetical protein